MLGLCLEDVRLYLQFFATQVHLFVAFAQQNLISLHRSIAKHRFDANCYLVKADTLHTHWVGAHGSQEV